MEAPSTCSDAPTAERTRLTRLSQAIRFYEQEKAALAASGIREHGDLVKSLVEPGLRDYFADVLPDSMKIGQGFTLLGDPASRGQNQIDLVIDFDGEQWSPTRDPSHHGSAPLYAAVIEARYRGGAATPSEVVAQVAGIVRRLDSIIQRNVECQRKCFTSSSLPIRSRAIRCSSWEICADVRLRFTSATTPHHSLRTGPRL